MKKVCVVGLGYIGLPTALFLSKYPYFVYGYDIDEYRVNQINNGISPIKEKGIDKKLEHAVKYRKLIASTIVNEADIYIIAVPTPIEYDFISDDNIPNLDFVFEAVKNIQPYVTSDSLVIVESFQSFGKIEINLPLGFKTLLASLINS